jgi:rhamnosyltransferase
MKKIDFSIVITTKNSMGVIQRLVDLLRSQDFDHPYEVIFMDNDSTDGTVEYLERAGFEFQRIINVPEGHFSHSRTRLEAAEQAAGRFIVFFTDDIVPMGNGFLRELTRPLIESPAVAAYGVFQINWRDSDPVDAYLHNDWHLAIDDFSGPVSTDEWETLSPEERRRLSNFDNCASCMDRELLLKIKFPDVPYGEDMFFAKCLILSGYKVAISRAAMFFHWHKMSFAYLLSRMCIDQHLSLKEFQIVYVKSKTRVILSVLKRMVHRSLISLFRLRIPIKDRFYWMFFNIKILNADFWGKYLGSLTESVEKKRFSIIDKWLFKRKKVIIERIYNQSIIRD